MHGELKGSFYRVFGFKKNLDPGIEPVFLVSLALAGELFTTSATWELGIKHASLVAQMVKNWPAMREPWVQPLA